MAQTTCSYDDSPHTGGRLVRGLCGKHYQKVMNAEKPCKIDGCNNGGAYAVTGLCGTHHHRLKKHGDALVTIKGKVHKVVTDSQGMRVCKACGVPKPDSEYHRDKGGSDGLRAQCKPCRNGYMSEYYDDTREARQAYLRNRRATQGKRVRELDRARYVRDREKRIELASDNVRIRRARMLGVLTDPGVTVLNLRKIHGDKCCYCGVSMTFKPGRRGDGIQSHRATLEHLYPISRGGSHTFLNSALACHECNTSKNDKTVAEWEAWKAGELYGREKTVTSRKGSAIWRDGTTSVLF